MNDAVAAMNELLNRLPELDQAFTLSKANSLTTLETSRITNEGIIASYLSDRKLGFSQDSRIKEYSDMKNLNFPEIKSFHENLISGKKFTYCVVGSKNKLSVTDLSKLGAFEMLSLEKIFGY